MTTTSTTTTAICPAELYLARRSTPASRATAKSALNAAARALLADTYTDVDWALSYANAATIRTGLNQLQPGWSKQIWSAVRQTAAEARRLRLIDADTLSSIFELPAPRGSGGRRGYTPTDDDDGRLLAVAASDTSLRGRRDQSEEVGGKQTPFSADRGEKHLTTRHKQPPTASPTTPTVHLLSRTHRSCFWPTRVVRLFALRRPSHSSPVRRVVRLCPMPPVCRA